MSVTRGRDNDRERAIRSGLHRLGFRFCLHDRPIADFRRSADIVFRPWKIAVFLDGCFWHACPIHATWPKRNAAWWRAKLRQNIERDRETSAFLRRQGWKVLRIWDHVPSARAVAGIAFVLEKSRQNNHMDWRKRPRVKATCRAL